MPRRDYLANPLPLAAGDWRSRTGCATFVRIGVEGQHYEVENFAACMALPLAASCAKDPGAIAAISMPVNAYAGLTCEQLHEEYNRSRLALEQVSAQQRQAVTGDAFGVFLIGVPVSSLTGADKEGAVAQHKGEIIALEAQRRNQNCAGPEYRSVT